ncbi:MAG: ACP S-malonyltransferase [Lachnospiraceae bacterium]|nr:ACP S-malonyltransferase [Lachnospiraceae bacterium]
MKIAFLYAGQGAQHVGMGRDLYESYPEFREAFDAGHLDFDLKEICFQDPENKISQTQYTQPAMVAFACGVTKILKNHDITPQGTCGLSLGEYSALASAGVFDSATAIDLVAYRGQVMALAAKDVECGMSAVLGLEEETLLACCKKAASTGYVTICNYNCPGQLVISGEKAAVEEASALAKEAGAKRVLPLAVSGPFHTKFMEPAGKALEWKFATTPFHKPAVPVYYNVLGDTATSDVDVAKLLVQQVQSPVRMERDLRKMLADGYDCFIEIGPGKALSGFLKKVLKDAGIPADTIQIHTVETKDDVEALLSAMAA